MPSSWYGPGTTVEDIKKVLCRPAPTLANQNHTVSLTPTQSEMKAALDAHGAKINEIIQILKDAGLFI